MIKRLGLNTTKSLKTKRYDTSEAEGVSKSICKTDSSRNAFPKQLSSKETHHLWGGFSHGEQLLPGIIVMDVSEIAQEIEPDLEPSAKVATVHIGFKQALTQRKALKRDMLKAHHELMRHGFTHVSITGPLAALAQTRLTCIAKYKNAKTSTVPGLILHQITLSMLWTAALFQSKRRRQNIGQLIALAPASLKHSYLFDLGASGLKR